MKNTLTGIIIVLAIAAIGMAYVLTGKMLKNQAIDGCYQAGRLEFQNSQKQNATVPDNYWYNDCMTKKGYGK